MTQIIKDISKEEAESLFETLIEEFDTIGRFNILYPQQNGVWGIEGDLMRGHLFLAAKDFSLGFIAALRKNREIK